ncbi:MAG: hypothetical protein ABIP85_12430 [Chthoniobacteraceae bacterium]
MTSALDFSHLFGDQLGEFAIDLLLVGHVADAADEEVGALNDEDPVCGAPLHEFEVVGFDFCTSRMAARKGFPDSEGRRERKR